MADLIIALMLVLILVVSPSVVRCLVIYYHALAICQQPLAINRFIFFAFLLFSLLRRLARAPGGRGIPPMGGGLTRCKKRNDKKRDAPAKKKRHPNQEQK